MENIFFRNNKINNLNYIFLLTIPIFLIINHNVADFLIVIMGLIFLYLILLKKNTFKINAIFENSNFISILILDSILFGCEKSSETRMSHLNQAGVCINLNSYRCHCLFMFIYVDIPIHTVYMHLYVWDTYVCVYMYGTHQYIC